MAERGGLSGLYCPALVPRCSVIVCTRQRPDLLARCLTSLAKLDGPDPEVIVVDNSAGDAETERVTARAGARYVVEARVGLSRARNAGIAAATGELIAFIDDDAIAEPGWLRRHAEVLTNNPLMASTGRMLPIHTDLHGSMDLGEQAFVLDRSSPWWFERANFSGLGSGSNMVFKRQAFEDGVRFRETLGLGTPLGGFEEYYLFFTMIRGGAQVAYIPDAVVRHADSELPPELERPRITRNRRFTAAYLTLLLVEEPAVRRRTARYILQTLRRQRQVPWRNTAPSSPLRVLTDGYRGPLLYYRSRLSAANRSRSLSRRARGARRGAPPTSTIAQQQRRWRQFRRGSVSIPDVVFYTPWIGSILSGAELPPGGAERQILLLAKALVKRGVFAAIVVYGSGNLPTDVEGVSILRRPPYRHRGTLMTKVFETFAIWKALWRAPSPTIVYRGVGLELGLIAVYAKIARRRVVFSTANIVDFDWPTLLRKRRDATLYELGVRLANGIVVQTEEQVALCERAFDRRPTVIKSIAGPAETRHSRPEAFLWVGRLIGYKRPMDYIALAKAVPEARFWMVGVPSPFTKEDKRLLDAVHAAAEEAPNLELLRPRPHEEIEELMSRAVASVNTAEFEGMPNVLLEAWARGVPALVLNHDPGGVIAEHGLGGFANGSMENFISLARELWATRNRRDALSERCRDYIAANHSPDAAATRWIQVLGVHTGSTATNAESNGAAQGTTAAERACAE
jgi:glycosyltransferase involved in cell wall biosynthesis